MEGDVTDVVAVRGPFRQEHLKIPKLSYEPARCVALTIGEDRGECLADRTLSSVLGRPRSYAGRLDALAHSEAHDLRLGPNDSLFVDLWRGQTDHSPMVAVEVPDVRIDM